VEQLAARARELACAAVVVLPPLVAAARAYVGRGAVRVVAAVGLPFGAEGAEAMAATCAQAVADGADVLDVVASLPLLANGDYPAARDELAAAVAAAGGAAPEGRHILVRAVIETCYLQPAAWRLAARLAHAAGCDGVVCATGLGPEGATPTAIEALRDELPAGSVVKAQGGIRSLADAQRALGAGADRLGVADPASLLAELAEASVARRRRPAAG
jgi:deoxyribose-phosphate aldolase